MAGMTLNGHSPYSMKVLMTSVRQERPHNLRTAVNNSCRPLLLQEPARVLQMAMSETRHPRHEKGRAEGARSPEGEGGRRAWLGGGAWAKTILSNRGQ